MKAAAVSRIEILGNAAHRPSNDGGHSLKGAALKLFVQRIRSNGYRACDKRQVPPHLRDNHPRSSS